MVEKDTGDSGREGCARGAGRDILPETTRARDGGWAWHRDRQVACAPALALGVLMLLSALLSVALAGPALPSVDLGSPAPLFMLPAINEEAAVKLASRPQIELGELVGVSPRVASSAVVLYFFDRAHGGEGLSSLDRVHRQYSGKGVAVVAISLDPGELGPLAAWVEKQKVQFPVVRDEFGVVRSRYGITEASLPLTLVIDREGDLFAVGQPTAAELEAAVGEEVAPLVKAR